MRSFTKTAIAAAIALSSSFASAADVYELPAGMQATSVGNGQLTIWNAEGKEVGKYVVTENVEIKFEPEAGYEASISVKPPQTSSELENAQQFADEFYEANPELDANAGTDGPLFDMSEDRPNVDGDFGVNDGSDDGFFHPESDVDPDMSLTPDVDDNFTADKAVEELTQAWDKQTNDIAQNASAISDLNNRVDGIQNQINDMAKDIDTLNDGVAGAMAMSALPQAFMPEETIIGFGAAHFNGSNAIAVGASHKFNNNWTGNLKASFGGETGVAVGVGYSF